MRILKRGKKEADRIHIGTCRSCGCTVEFANHEGRVVRDQREGDYIQVNCPECLTHITVAL